MNSNKFTFVVLLGLLAVMLMTTHLLAQGDSTVQTGLAMSPITLDYKGLNPALVARGSYLINGPGNCSGCHTVGARYLPGGNPFLGQPKLENTVNFLAGTGPSARSSLAGISHPTLRADLEAYP